MGLAGACEGFWACVLSQPCLYLTWGQRQAGPCTPHVLRVVVLCFCWVRVLSCSVLHHCNSKHHPRGLSDPKQRRWCRGWCTPRPGWKCPAFPKHAHDLIQKPLGLGVNAASRLFRQRLCGLQTQLLFRKWAEQPQPPTLSARALMETLPQFWALQPNHLPVKILIPLISFQLK